MVFAGIVHANEGAAQALTELVVAGEAAGLEIYQDIHADRGYTETGQLIPRSQRGAKQTCTSASAILDQVARNLLAWGIFGSCVPASGPRAAEREVEMLISQKDGRMSRILSIGAAQLGTIQSSGDRASVVQPMLDLMRQARQRVILRD